VSEALDELPAREPGASPRAVHPPHTLERLFVYATAMRAWEARDPDFGRPIAAPLEQCAKLLDVDLATVCEAAANVEPYIRADGTRSGA
jgi:hypothetical protein